MSADFAATAVYHACLAELRSRRGRSSRGSCTARPLGASNVQILKRHVLPNVSGIVLVAPTSVLGQALLLGATIEVFSYGLRASRWPSLGNLLAHETMSRGLPAAGLVDLGLPGGRARPAPRPV